MVISSWPALACLSFSVMLQKVPQVVGDMVDEGKVPYATKASSWMLFNQGASRSWTPWTWKATWAPSGTPYHLRHFQRMDTPMMRLVTSWASIVNPV